MKLTLTAVVTGKSRFALASTKDALAVGRSRASAWTTEGQIACQADQAGGRLTVSVVVVEGHEPMTRFHKLQNLFWNQIGTAGSLGSDLAIAVVVTADQVEYVVVSVGGQGVASGVKRQTGATRNAQFKAHVRSLRMVKLHVPVAVGGNDAVGTFAHRHLSEGCAVRWETPRWKRISIC